ncbi:hypothetical protein MMC12_001266 [Toensbergia leucococca]|nr:hypothetical protein [Toensbergia leucococca]
MPLVTNNDNFLPATKPDWSRNYLPPRWGYPLVTNNDNFSPATKPDWSRKYLHPRWDYPPWWEDEHDHFIVYISAFHDPDVILCWDDSVKKHVYEVLFHGYPDSDLLHKRSMELKPYWEQMYKVIAAQRRYCWANIHLRFDPRFDTNGDHKHNFSKLSVCPEQKGD